MTARELRIGNYINPKFPMQVVNIFPDEVNADFEGNEGDVFEFKNEDIEGIPIDEYWLLRWKFKRQPWGLVRGRFLFKDGLNNRHKKLTMEILSGFRIEVEFIHELQNLYFSLTGEELE